MPLDRAYKDQKYTLFQPKVFCGTIAKTIIILTINMTENMQNRFRKVHDSFERTKSKGHYLYEITVFFL